MNLQNSTSKLALFALLIFTFSLSAQTPDLPSDVEGISTSWWSQVQKDLAQKEYVVNYDTKDKSYRAFNRKNGIISSLNAGKFLLKPTLDSGQTEYAWRTSLETASIKFDGISTYQAKHASTAIQKDNTVEFNHENFTEQYVNTQQGIRQNFILHQGPKADQVRIKIKVNGLSLNKRNDNEIALYEKNKGGIQTHLLYKDIKSWDANGLALASKLDVEGEYIVLVVNTEDAAYPITIDPISTTASTTLEENQGNARFGFSVSSAGDVNGDGYSDVIVGAERYDNGQSQEGGAFIYHGSSSGVTATASTTLESNQAYACFGISVSSAGDVNGDGYSDVIVGANGYENGQTDEGAAFIYHGSASGISTTASTTLEENQAYSGFGQGVSSAGDVNGDGYSDVIVGAYFYENGQSNEGVAFIYHGASSGISTTASTTLEENQAGAYFGISVSSAGDVNGDGYSDVIVGAGYYDNGQYKEGGAFIYHGSASGISTTASTSLEENQAGAYFGISVSSAGDVNGDGYSDVIVGARFYDNGQTKEGVAFIYHGSSSGISTTANTTLEENQPSAYLGRSVSGAGDVNGDGYSDVIVGAYAYGNGGGAFIYRGSSCRNEFRDTIIGCQLYTWTNGVTYTASDTIAKDTFVNAVGCDSIVTLNLTIIKADEYITTQPSDQSVVPSTDVGFTIGSSISTGVKYQWQMDVGLGFQLMSNAGQYSGTQSDSLKVSGVTISNDNQLFKCIVTANDCSDTSDVATLTIDRVNISEISKDQIFHIYPNPTNEIIHIQVNAEHIGISYTILSSIGVKVLEGEIKELDATVNIVDLQEGIYFVQIGEDLRQIFKIIKK